MDHQKRSLRLGAALILCALLLRLGAAGWFRAAADFLTKPDITAFLIYLETGRKVRFSPSTEPVTEFFRESALPDFAEAAETKPAEIALPAFAPQDAQTVKFKNNSGRKFDAAALVAEPLQWNLTEAAPAVLILHTHATESYTREKGEDYKETSPFRTLEEAYNMVCVGEHLAELLEAGGITVIHDRQLHDYPSYNGSYSNARRTITQHLKENPSICMVLDLHRDASGSDKKQMRTEAEVDGKPSAQIMFVVGTGSSALQNPHWEENLALALKLQVQMERLAPGICRNVNLRAQRFNHDLSAGTLLVEVGAAGNTRQEALTAVEVLAQAIVELARGTQTAEE